MPRAQTTVTLEDAVLARAPVADASAAFIVGFFEKGPVDQLVPCENISEVKAVFGDRVSHSSAYDAIETIFRLGGGTVYPRRQLGPTPVKATANLLDQAGSSAPGDVALVATAKQYGEYFNDYDVVVTVDGTDFVISVQDENGDTVETSPTLADRAAAVTWSDDSSYITLTLGASNEDPRAGDYSLAGGTDDYANSTITEFTAALDGLADLGAPKGGFVAAPGQTTDAQHAALAAHALAYFRQAWLDSPDADVVADVVADVASITDDEGANAACLAHPWVQVSGVAAGSTVTVPPSALVIGLLRRNDGNGQSIAQPAAGPLYGVAPDWVTGVSQTFTEAEQDDLADGLVNVIRVENGQVVVNDCLTCADPDTRPQWSDCGGARVALQVAAEVDAAADKYRHSPLHRDTFMKLERDGMGICLKYAGAPHQAFYQRDNGDGTLDKGFSVDATSVNTPVTIAAKELHAQLTLTTNEHARAIEISIAKSAIV